MNFIRRTTEAGQVETAELEAIDKEVADLIEDAVAKAKSAPKPPVEELLADVYVSY